MAPFDKLRSALPSAWLVAAIAGAIGFTGQKIRLDAVTPWLPSGVAVGLMADRFCGTPDPIKLAKTKGRSDRLRRKANLRAVVECRSTTLAQHAGRSGCCLSNIGLTHSLGCDQLTFAAILSHKMLAMVVHDPKVTDRARRADVGLEGASKSRSPISK